MTAASAPSPFVYWAQDSDKLFLRVDLRDAKDVNVDIAARMLSFVATGIAAHGKADYTFSMDLADDVLQTPQIKVTGSNVEIELTKKKAEFWNSLNATSPRPHWLKFDFNRWQDPDGESEEENNLDLMSNEDKMKEWIRKYGGNLPESGSSDVNLDFVSTFYLFAFNVMMFMFHFYVLACITYGYLTSGSTYFKTFWEVQRVAFYTCTALQYMDVMHGSIGLTKSGWKTGLVQVTGRLTMLAIIDNCPEIHQVASTYLLMFVYFLIEQFRYPYYACSALGFEIYPLTWLRYSVWILLYPSGLFLEAVSFVRAIPYYYSSGRLGLTLPNNLNISFNFGVFLGVFLVTAFPKIAYTLVTHMKRQRSKKFAEQHKKKV